MLIHRRVTPSIKIASTHFYTWVETGTETVNYLAHEHNPMSLGLEPEPLNPESSSLTMRPPRLHKNNTLFYVLPTLTPISIRTHKVEDTRENLF